MSTQTLQMETATSQISIRLCSPKHLTTRPDSTADSKCPGGERREQELIQNDIVSNGKQERLTRIDNSCEMGGWLDEWKLSGREVEQELKQKISWHMTINFLTFSYRSCRTVKGREFMLNSENSIYLTLFRLDCKLNWRQQRAIKLMEHFTRQSCNANEFIPSQYAVCTGYCNDCFTVDSMRLIRSRAAVPYFRETVHHHAALGIVADRWVHSHRRTQWWHTGVTALLPMAARLLWFGANWSQGIAGGPTQSQKINKHMGLYLPAKPAPRPSVICGTTGLKFGRLEK